MPGRSHDARPISRRNARELANLTHDKPKIVALAFGKPTRASFLAFRCASFGVVDRRAMAAFCARFLLLDVRARIADFSHGSGEKYLQSRLQRRHFLCGTSGIVPRTPSSPSPGSDLIVSRLPLAKVESAFRSSGK